MIPGYNTNGMVHHRLPEALEMIRAAGFQAVALTLDPPHLDPLHATTGAVKEAADLLADLELEVVVETGGRYILDPQRKHRPNLIEEDAMAREKRLDLLLRSIAIARDLGANTLSFWSGVIPQGVTRDDAMARLEDALEQLLAAGTRVGVRLALEPEPGHLIERVADWGGLASRITEENFGLCLDVGHVVANQEGDLPVVLKAVDPQRLFQVHLEDTRPGAHEHLEPGEGVIDFPAVLATLAGSGYRGPVCWELSRSSHRAPEALTACWACWRQSV